MLTTLIQIVFALWAVGAIVALVLVDISARREARAPVVKPQRRPRQAPARVAINAR